MEEVSTEPERIENGDRRGSPSLLLLVTRISWHHCRRSGCRITRLWINNLIKVVLVMVTFVIAKWETDWQIHLWPVSEMMPYTSLHHPMLTICYCVTVKTCTSIHVSWYNIYITVRILHTNLWHSNINVAVSIQTIYTWDIHDKQII